MERIRISPIYCNLPYFGEVSAKNCNCTRSVNRDVRPVPSKYEVMLAVGQRCSLQTVVKQTVNTLIN
jgi:hypothetical protein